jgi:hypothetical protein
LFDKAEWLFVNMLHQNKSSCLALLNGCLWICYIRSLFETFEYCLWICYIRINPVWLSWIDVYEYVTSFYCLTKLNGYLYLWICYIRINPVWFCWINAYEYVTSDHCLRLLNNCLWICYIRTNPVWLCWINAYEYATSDHCLRLLNIVCEYVTSE